MDVRVVNTLKNMPSSSGDESRTKQNFAGEGLHFSDAKSNSRLTLKGQRLGMVKDGMDGKKPVLRPDGERPGLIQNSLPLQKLKAILEVGAFDFDESEKKVLARILDQSSKETL